MNIVSSNNVTLSQNVFHNAEKYHMHVGEAGSLTINHNLMIGAKNRDDLNYGTGLTDNSACLYMAEMFDYRTADIKVFENLCQGSDEEGFGLPLMNCDLLDNELFYNNTAGSCNIGFIYNKNNKLTGCLAASNIKAYANFIGLIANPTGFPQLKYKNMMFAENRRGMTLRHAARGSRDNFAEVSKCWFSPYVRLNCPTCYSPTTNSFCRNSHAIRMLAVTVSGENFPPIRVPPVGFDIICTAQVPDARVYITDTKFENYGKDFSYCQNNYVFIRHNIASDMTAGHYLRNTVCQNCDVNYALRADRPDEKWRGWFGGCGSLDCTGPNNYLIEDQTGEFLGFVGSIVANNTMVGAHLQNCDFVPTMNSYLCRRTDLAIM